MFYVPAYVLREHFLDSVVYQMFQCGATGIWQTYTGEIFESV